MALYLYKKSSKLGLWGEAVVTGRLNATYRGAAQCLLETVPEPRITPIHDVFGYSGSARAITGPGVGSESALFGAGEPTF